MLITGCGKYLCHAATSCRSSMSVSPAARGGGHAGILSENLLQKLILQDLLQKLILQELLQKLTLQDLLQKLLVQGMQRIRNKEKVNMIFTAGGNTGHVSARFSVTEKVRKINDLFNTACRLVFNLEIIYNILSVFRRRSGLAYRNMLII